MSFKHVAILAVVVTATVAAVTAFAGANPTVAPAMPATSAAANSIDASACPQAPWPFGCQWREPTRRVVARNPRNF